MMSLNGVYGVALVSRIDEIIRLFSFAKEPYKKDNILQKRPIILTILLTVATPYQNDLMRESE